MAWRLALACDTLRSEIKAETPSATIYTIGDQAHASRASDHNPNSANVVCAIDIMGTGGVNMPDLAERIRARQHPAGKYVIFNRRIAKASEGWVWRSFDGDPHTDHIHVSVGVGPDGRSTGPYDNTDPWLEDDMEQSEKLARKTSNPNRTVGDLYYDLSNLRDYLVDVPGGTEPVSPPQAGSRIDLLLQAARKVLAPQPEQPAPIVTDEQLERVLRKVLGGVDGASPPAQG